MRRGATVRLGYLPQQAADIDPALRVLEAAEEVGRVLAVDGGTELTAGQLLESFGFPAAKQWTRVADLSGGERRRLQLLRLLLAGSNVLLLDEPTNDLDIETLRALEDVLDGWPGTLVVVTHDRYFLERVCDSVQALVGDGQLAALPGGVEEYLARLRDRRTGKASRRRPPRGGDEPATPARRNAGCVARRPAWKACWTGWRAGKPTCTPNLPPTPASTKSSCGSTPSCAGCWRTRPRPRRRGWRPPNNWKIVEALASARALTAKGTGDPERVGRRRLTVAVVRRARWRRRGPDGTG